MNFRNEKEIMLKWEKDNNKPIVSILCPVYNHEKYIIETLESILMQETKFAFEVLVHDDASTDRTSTIIRNYEIKYPNIIKPTFQSKNQLSIGIKPLWNHLLPKVKSKYIALCDGDDYWTDPYKLQKQVDFLETNEEYTLCASRFMHIDENSNILGEGPTLDPLRIDQHDEYNRQFENFTLDDYLSYPYNIFQYSSVLFRNIDDLTFGMDKGIYGGDLILSINLLKKGRAFYFLDDYFSTYRIHANGVWNKNGKIKKAKIKVADYKKLRILYSEYSEEINKILKCTYNELSIEYARNGDILKSFFNYLLSLPNDSEYINDSGFRRFFKLIFNIKEKFGNKNNL